MTYRAHLTLKSRNKKVGKVPVSTTERKSCPTACPFNNGNGCYASLGPLALFWDKVDSGQAGTDWNDFCGQIEALPDGQFWRHNQAGDLPGDGAKIDAAALSQLVASNKDKRGFTYTHYNPKTGDNRHILKQANNSGFTINLSGNNLKHADELVDLNVGPVVAVLPADHAKKKTTTPKGRPVITCPATYKDNVSCASCQLCQRRDRKTIVGFPAHGAAKRKASTIASN